MSFPTRNQPITPGERGSLGGRPAPRVSASSGGTLNAILGAILQKKAAGSRRVKSNGGGKLTKSQLDRFLQLPRSILTRETAAKRAAAVSKPKSAVRPAPPVLSSKPGVPLERMAGLPPDNRFSVPSRDFLTGGQPVGSIFPPTPTLPTPTAPARTQEKAVSIWADLGKGISKAVVGGVSQRVSAAIAPKSAAAIIGPAIATAGRVMPAIGRVLGSRTVAAAGTGAVIGSMLGGNGGGGACPAGWHPNKQDGVGGPAGTYCVRNRRMNVGNARAARRSVRRLKGARKLLQDIERMMPRKKAARRQPAHHHHPAAGA